MAADSQKPAYAPPGKEWKLNEKGESYLVDAPKPVRRLWPDPWKMWHDANPDEPDWAWPGWDDPTDEWLERGLTRRGKSR